MTNGSETLHEIEGLSPAAATPIGPDDQKSARRDDPTQQPLHVGTQELVGDTIMQ